METLVPLAIFLSVLTTQHEGPRPIPQDQQTAALSLYFNSYHSPLTSLVGDFMAVSSRYSLDWRLLAALSVVESTAGRHIPYNSFNPYGFGCSQPRFCYTFSNFREANETVGSFISRKAKVYQNTGKISDLSRVWKPQCQKCWTKKVEREINKLNSIYEDLQ